MEIILFEKLLERIKRTTRCRYHASRRLKIHHRFSQWTIAILSSGLIFIPLIQVFGATFDIPLKLCNVFQTILAVLILVFSLLLSQENFFSRSENMHKNGVELGRLVRKIEGIIENNKEKTETIDLELYNKLKNEYYDILEKYENHETIDFMNAKLNIKPDEKIKLVKYWCIKIEVFFRCFLIFALYLLPCLLVLMLFILYIYNVPELDLFLKYIKVFE